MKNHQLLAIFAHPDDEAFRCGGTLALLALKGVSVHILTFTRGQAGSCGQPPVCAQNQLGTVRTHELYCSCQALGLAEPQVLDFEDGALVKVSEDEGVAWIAASIQSIRPQVLITWPLHGLSGHLDHVAVSHWTRSAYLQAKNEGMDELAALYYLAMPDSLARNIGMKQLHTTADDEITVMVNVQSVWQKKISAIACHRTQAGESPILQAPLERQLVFLGWEHFYRAIASQPEDILLKLDSRQAKVNKE